MFDASRLIKLNIFSTITVAIIILVVIFADSIISDGSSHRNQLQTHQAARILKLTSEIQPRYNLKPEELGTFQPGASRRSFDSTVRQFFTANNCKLQVFMTWIAPVASFGARQFFALESLFSTNPRACLIILSRTLDSAEGLKILEPLVALGFRVQPTAPDWFHLLKNTPAEGWLEGINNGAKNAGEIPLAQNLSNLIRLAVLYKYGGVYLDLDFIILNDFSRLRNSIGAQSVDVNGNWTRLNNAVLVFDKNHPLVYKFLEEFASTFDGNRWGHNGPYLVTRVVARTGVSNFTVLPPAAFYPVDWTKVAGFFARPNDTARAKWVGKKVRQLVGSSYGVHLWNSRSSGLEIEEGSVIGRLVSDYCVVCNHRFFSSS